MGEGTIYPLMRRMQTDGLVDTYLEESSSGPPRKYYQLTKAGHAALASQKAEWNVFDDRGGQGPVGRERRIDRQNIRSSPMTKAEFLDTLHSRLAGLPQSRSTT